MDIQDIIDFQEPWDAPIIYIPAPKTVKREDLPINIKTCGGRILNVNVLLRKYFFVRSELWNIGLKIEEYKTKESAIFELNNWHEYYARNPVCFRSIILRDRKRR